jgi:hypothetical protein
LVDEDEENDQDDFIDDPLDGKEPNIAYYEKQMKRKDKENMELKYNNYKIN